MFINQTLVDDYAIRNFLFFYLLFYADDENVNSEIYLSLYMIHPPTGPLTGGQTGLLTGSQTGVKLVSVA